MQRILSASVIILASEERWQFIHSSCWRHYAVGSDVTMPRRRIPRTCTIIENKYIKKNIDYTLISQ